MSSFVLSRQTLTGQEGRKSISDRHVKSGPSTHQGRLGGMQESFRPKSHNVASATGTMQTGEAGADVCGRLRADRTVVVHPDRAFSRGG